MLLQFKTIDDAIWICDVQYLKWGRVSTPGTDPESKVLESGKLVPQGFGIYNFEGRTPKTEGPGAGLCSVGVITFAIGVTVKICIRANVPIKDFTMPAPIRQVLYEILPSDPKQIQNAIEEVAHAQGSEVAQSSRQEEPAVGGSLPETTAGAEQPEAEASVESKQAGMDTEAFNLDGEQIDA